MSDERGVAAKRVVLVVEGNQVGGNRFGAAIARDCRICIQPVPALWGLAKALGRPVGREGPLRNARQLRWALELAAEYGLELIVLALPGGVGTADMCAKATAAGVEVHDVRLE